VRSVTPLQNSEKIQIEPRHLLLLHQMIREHTEVPAFLFGSRVLGRARTYSDLDVCLRGQQVLPLSLLSDLSEAADDSSIPYVVDFSDFARLPEAFQREVVERGVNIDELISSHRVSDSQKPV